MKGLKDKKEVKQLIESVAQDWFGNNETTNQGTWDAREYYKSVCIQALRDFVRQYNKIK